MNDSLRDHERLVPPGPPRSVPDRRFADEGVRDAVCRRRRPGGVVQKRRRRWVHVRRDAAGRAVRGAPAGRLPEGQARLLPALRRRHGADAPVRRRAGAGRGGVHERQMGSRQARVDGHRPQRSYLGRGLLPGPWLAGVRPHAGTGKSGRRVFHDRGCVQPGGRRDSRASRRLRGHRRWVLRHRYRGQQRRDAQEPAERDRRHRAWLPWRRPERDRRGERRRRRGGPAPARRFAPGRRARSCCLLQRRHGASFALLRGTLAGSRRRAEAISSAIWPTRVSKRPRA